jgi:hypothetical protein
MAKPKPEKKQDEKKASPSAETRVFPMQLQLADRRVGRERRVRSDRPPLHESNWKECSRPRPAHRTPELG